MGVFSILRYTHVARTVTVDRYSRCTIRTLCFKIISTNRYKCGTQNGMKMVYWSSVVYIADTAQPEPINSLYLLKKKEEEENTGKKSFDSVRVSHNKNKNMTSTRSETNGIHRSSINVKCSHWTLNKNREIVTLLSQTEFNRHTNNPKKKRIDRIVWMSSCFISLMES